MAEPDISNNKLGRFITIEILASILISFFVAGTAWGLISKQVDSTDSEVTGVKARQEKIAEDVSNIKTDVGIIKAGQKNIKEDVEETKQEIRAIRELIQGLYNQ